MKNWLDRFSSNMQVMRKMAGSSSFWIDEHGDIIDVNGARGHRKTHGSIVMEKLREKHNIPINANRDDLIRENYPEIDDREWEVITGERDSIGYDIAMVDWNWIRVMGSNVQMIKDDNDTFFRAAEGLRKVYRHMANDITYSVDIFARGGSYRMDFEDIENGNVPSLTEAEMFYRQLERAKRQYGAD
jgi:hypothetical protein